jgi:hypothetical protein
LLLLVPGRLPAQCFEVRDVTSLVGAPGRDNPSYLQLVYDAARGLVVGLDGFTGNVYLYDGQHWADWTPPFGQGKPEIRGGAWVYDSARQVCLLLGTVPGATGRTPALYAYDADGWTRLAWVGTGPTAAGSYAAFDPARARAIFLVYGAAAPDPLLETWEWTGSAWEQGPSVAPKAPIAFAFDESNGIGLLASSSASQLDAVWYYRPANATTPGTWSDLHIAQPPTDNTLRSALVYDSHRSRIVRCCGVQGSFRFSGYSYSFDTWDWNRLSWVPDEPNLPEAAKRADAGATFDRHRNALVIYGGDRVVIDNGVGSNQSLGDTWERLDLPDRTSYVDFAATGTPDGSAAQPYQTVTQGVQAGNCVTVLSIAAGTYTESPLTISRPLQLEARNGVVTIR